MWSIELPEGTKAIGYKYLVDLYQLKVMGHHCWSYVSPKWEKRSLHYKDSDLTLFLYPPSTRISENPFDHLEFALKHEGVNLLILKNILTLISKEDLKAHVLSRPTGKYTRILWYLFEKFSGNKIDLPDLDRGTYTPVLDPEKYYCSKGTRSSRHRVLDNLLGSIEFAPTVRRTPQLVKYEEKQIGKIAHQLTEGYDPLILARAMRYLYTKETMSSWEIEREQPDNARLAKFVSLLHKADAIGPLSEQSLVNLQKSIVDPRFALNTYRDFQNYIGEEPGLREMILHFIPPRPCDVSALMQNLLHTYSLMEKSSLNAVVAASVLSFGFVFIHPFEDGNGRMHRFLIHYVLARLKFTPEGIVFPTSAAIVRNMIRYDKVLETFSKPLMERIFQYTINDDGEMVVQQDTKDYYRYIDFTPIAEYLFECVEKTITTDFKEELDFLAVYDKIKRLCKEVVDMPDQKIDLFIKCVRQNGGALSARKQESHFKMLTSSEIEMMQKIINQSNF
ncbi:MAG: Fic family protein [Parachlamydiaceae bacterium]|nr:Fic family protein [Parachlamydiaceae bacterium]